MRWEAIAHYLIVRGFGVSSRIYERILVPTEESPTNQKSGSMVDPAINRTLLTISLP